MSVAFSRFTLYSQYESAFSLVRFLFSLSKFYARILKLTKNIIRCFSNNNRLKDIFINLLDWNLK